MLPERPASSFPLEGVGFSRINGDGYPSPLGGVMTVARLWLQQGDGGDAPGTALLVIPS